MLLFAIAYYENAWFVETTVAAVACNLSAYQIVGL
jgi:hypothetical protein